jgi:hypothetical protein
LRSIWLVVLTMLDHLPDRLGPLDADELLVEPAIKIG